MSYRGVVTVFRDSPRVEAGRGSIPLQHSDKLLEIEVAARTKWSLVKKISTMLSVLDDE